MHFPSDWFPLPSSLSTLTIPIVRIAIVIIIIIFFVVVVVVVTVFTLKPSLFSEQCSLLSENLHPILLLLSAYLATITRDIVPFSSYFWDTFTFKSLI